MTNVASGSNASSITAPQQKTQGIGLDEQILEMIKNKLEHNPDYHLLDFSSEEGSSIFINKGGAYTKTDFTEIPLYDIQEYIQNNGDSSFSFSSEVNNANSINITGFIAVKENGKYYGYYVEDNKAKFINVNNVDQEDCVFRTDDRGRLYSINEDGRFELIQEDDATSVIKKIQSAKKNLMDYLIGNNK